MTIRNDLSGPGPHLPVILHPDPAQGNQRPIVTQVKICKNYAVFYEVGSFYESGSGTIIPDLDPTWPKKYLTWPDPDSLPQYRWMLRVKLLEGLHLFLPDLTSVTEPFDANTFKYRSQLMTFWRCFTSVWRSSVGSGSIKAFSSEFLIHSSSFEF